MTNATKNHSDDLLNFCAIYEAHNIERWEYDLTTNSVKFMQQTTSPLSVGDSSVCN